MHVQIVSFTLGNLSEDDYIDSAHEVVADFSAQGGLLAKLWLERRQDGTYGALYFWRDKESMERFKASALFEGNNSELRNVTSQDSGVLKNLTRQTQPELEVLS